MGQVSHQSQSIQTFRIALLLKHRPQLENLGFLFGREVARVARLFCGSCCREVIVIIFGIEAHVRVFGRHDYGDGYLQGN